MKSRFFGYFLYIIICPTYWKFVIIIYDIDNEIDERYKDLIVNELTFIRENTSKIIKNAVVMS